MNTGKQLITQYSKLLTGIIPDGMYLIEQFHDIGLSVVKLKYLKFLSQLLLVVFDKTDRFIYHCLSATFIQDSFVQDP